MFTVIESVYDLQGVKIDSSDVANFETEEDANAFIDRQYEFKHDTPDDDGNYARWHVEAL